MSELSQWLQKLEKNISQDADQTAKIKGIQILVLKLKF